VKFGLFYNPQIPKPLGQRDWDPDQERDKFAEMFEQVELADRLGFDYVFLGEHHFTPEYAHNSSSEVLLGGLARSTKQIRLGTGIVHISHNDPVRTAERIATVDLISDGRVEFGMGPGSPHEIAPFLGNLSREEIHERSRQAAQIASDILGSTGLYPGTKTEYFDVPPVNVAPKPYQRPHPPLWASTTSTEGAIDAAERGLGLLILTAGGTDDVAAKVKLYWETFLARSKPIGRAANPAVFSFANGLVAPTDELAEERAREGVEFFGYGLMGGAVLGVSEPDFHLYETFRDFKEGRGDKRPFVPPFDFAASPGHIVAGVDRAKKMVEDIEATNADAMLFTQQEGWTKHEHIMESIELIGEHIIPEIRARHGEHQAWRAEQLKSYSYPTNSSV
jgi:alkanesulfonate monooxygenase SsuD/methylene tetrahydromethanopterin reductase-like flavin-dependent oxidoreductase (luciferase family)